MTNSVDECVTILLDADITAYQFASRGQTSYKFGTDPDDVAVEVLPVEDIIPSMVEHIEELKETLKADRVIVCLSCPSAKGWRRGILPEYKLNRNPAGVPVLLQELKQYLRENYETFERPTLEADDVMGILATATVIKGRKIIVSIDKDMNTIPCTLYNPSRGTLVEVSEEDADYYHLTQALTGDTTDNYKGCPKVGAVGAAKLLVKGDHKGNWERVVKAFVSKGLTAADALLQARVARICRTSEYDFKLKQVKLWQPPEIGEIKDDD